MQGLATAFQIPVEYFYAPVTRDEAIAYLTDIENVELLEVLQQRVQNERQQKIADIALRASHLDEEGIDAIAQMIDYVLKRNPK